MPRFMVVLIVLATAIPASATPAIVRDGANHHLGDDSFVARFGRAPTAADPEAVRMRVHLVYVRDLLAGRPATSPALAPRRAELLGYLGEYIDKGITPRNTYVAHRSPVFIDRDGAICAVGYLIERSVGRALPEAIAATLRLAYLEDIAAARPDVAAWIATSGFTLDELASIQPGYEGPEVMHASGWLARATNVDEMEPRTGVVLPPDGAYHDEATGIHGRIARGQMVGVWTRTIDGKQLGRGTFVRGAGAWTSFRADGTKLASGPFVRSRPHGTWRFFHPSGRLAATGPMRDGARDGAWTFHHDRAGSPRLSVGRFRAGEVVGPWRHYATSGALVATAKGRAWVGLTLDVEPGPSGVRHEIHGGIPADDARLHGLYLGGTRLYVDHVDRMYDAEGHILARAADGTWTQRACGWSGKRRAIARRGDATTLHQLLLADGGRDDCAGEPIAVPAPRARRYERLLAAQHEVHAPIPAFDVSGAGTPLGTTTDGALGDLATYLAHHMAWYIEWPHVDDSFRTIYATLPGYARADEPAR